ncbi:MAG: hypothetical protein DMD89_00220 [Candidatus Rokuibacteriota bacterium]|nr:MAG: hypothetical protein DMD89_00220 [Candidatus Rokubacteria bacterium]
MKRLLLPLLAIAASTMILPISASAEWFADLYLGSVFTQKHDVETGILGVSATIQDVTFDTTAIGARVLVHGEGLLGGGSGDDGRHRVGHGCLLLAQRPGRVIRSGRTHCSNCSALT